MKHEVKIIPKEEILANRSNAYEFIDFDKKETLEEAFDRIFDSLDYILFDFCSFEQGAKWQKEQYTVEEQHVGHSINDLDKSYMKGFNEGAEWQKTEMEYFAIAFAEWFICHYTEEAFYEENYTKEILEKYKQEKGL
jgi:hypothetical protein